MGLEEGVYGSGSVWFLYLRPLITNHSWQGVSGGGRGVRERGVCVGGGGGAPVLETTPSSYLSD